MADGERTAFIYQLDGVGGAKSLELADLATAAPGSGVIWAHLHRTTPANRTWLLEESGLDPIVCDTLLAVETRPRCTPVGAGAVLNLRAVNLNPGADVEDMVSIRIWVEPGRVVSVRTRRLLGAQDLREALAEGKGPISEGDIVSQLARRLTERMEPVISELEDNIDQLEEQMLTVGSKEVRARLSVLRREAIELRRYIAPQREALARLVTEDFSFLDTRQRSSLRETYDKVTRYVEDLDSAREHGAVINDELSSRISEQMNRNMYVLSLVAGIFLPLGLLTGLLGINVGGMPGTENPWAFAVVSAALVGLGLIEVAIFRRLKWL